MPKRTIHLKMVLGKKERTADLRRALWTTHRLVNQGVKRIEQVLLLCRGASYWTLGEDGEPMRVPEGDVVADALKMARDAQRRNGREGVESDDDIRKALRILYEQLVPSCLLDEKGNPKDGKAQEANAWVSPLMDRTSKGNLAAAEKLLDPSPAWIEKKEQGLAEWEHESISWLESSDAQRLQNAVGRTPTWRKKLAQGTPWQDDFIKAQNELRHKVMDGASKITLHLKEMGLLPLIDPSFKQKLEPGGKGVSRWDRLLVKLAVAHFLSWESWNYSTRKAHAEAQAEVMRLREEYQGLESAFKALREYETERHAELKRVATVDDANPSGSDSQYPLVGPCARRLAQEWRQSRETYRNLQ